MSATTTIRLPDDLKARVASAAKRRGGTAHNLILEAIAEKVEQEELRAAFDEEAEARFANLLQTGESIAWGDMKRYLEARASGKKTPAPVARKLAL
ncbi:MAG: ribbon-helix-helix protein, CopG family [Azoarcus sp.]|jgi:predicted transcriptional regulator|nr:ribbon-helix-helix protein, CopG family [Azoarcus sp.]